MGYSILLDGTIKADTLKEALDLRAALLQRAGASKGGANRWKHLDPERRANLSAGAAESSRKYFAANPGKGSISEKGGKFCLMVCIEGKPRWAGTWPTREAAEGAQTQVLEARRAGLPLPDFVRPHRSQRTAAEKLVDEFPAEEESRHAPIWPEWSSDAPALGANDNAPPPVPIPPPAVSAPSSQTPTAKSGETEPDQAGWGDEGAGARQPVDSGLSHRPSLVGEPPPVPGEPASAAPEEPAPSRWLTKKALAYQLPPGPKKREYSRRAAEGIAVYWARKRSARAAGTAMPALTAPLPTCTENANSVHEPEAAPCAPAQLPPRCFRCFRVGHVDADCPKTSNRAASPEEPRVDRSPEADLTDLVDVPDAEPTVFPDFDRGECQACGRIGHWANSPACPLSSEGKDPGAPVPEQSEPETIFPPPPPSITEGQLDMKRHLAVIEDGDPIDEERPRTRGECEGQPRPCGFVSCRHHLALDVKESGNLVRVFGDLEIADMRKTCSLDLADEGGITLDAIGRALNITRERIRQIEVKALANAARNAKRLGIKIEFPRDRESNAPEDTL